MGKRLTEQAYIKGLNEGYAMGKAQYIEATKNEVANAIEIRLCGNCPHYDSGKFSEKCHGCQLFNCNQAVKQVVDTINISEG